MLLRHHRNVFALTAALIGLSLTNNTIAAPPADLQVQGFENIKANNFPKALDCFNTALKEHPDSWIIMQSVANCQMELGQYDKALASLQKSIEVGGLHASQCKNMAAVFQRMGDAKKALNWLELACKLEPAMQGNLQVMAAISKLQDPDNNPIGSPSAPDYLSGLTFAKGWSKAAMPLKVYIRQNVQLPGFYPAFTASVRDALDQWCNATSKAVSYQFVNSAESADFICDYTDHRELVSANHELGIDGITEMLVKQDSSPGRANIVILVKDGPGAPTFRKRELVTLCCLHEVGHALGMHGHSPNSHDVMFPAASLTGAAKLSMRDKNTIKLIYQQ